MAKYSSRVGSQARGKTADNVADAELFDPSTGTWAATASMSIDRFAHTLTLLASGQVVVAAVRVAAGLTSIPSPVPSYRIQSLALGFSLAA